MKEVKIDAWHFVCDERALAHSGLGVEAGYLYTENGQIEICRSGLHGSRRVYDALGFAPGSYLCKVRMWGEITEHPEKLVSRHREVIDARDVTAELRLWGCWCVRNTPISGGRTTWDLLNDERSRNAVEVAERFARSEATREELGAAWDAAWGAALGAARGAALGAAWGAARDAAWGAARDAALGAARGAARGAAWGAARDAARDAALGAAWGAAAKFQGDELERRMVELFA